VNKTSSNPVMVQILGREYRVACQSGEEDDLLASAHFLDRKMREIKSIGKVIGNDRIAVMTALNLAHELLQHETRKDNSAEQFSQRLRAMQEKIEFALNRS